MTARLRAPGLHRGILAVIPGIGFAYALIIVIRAASGLHHVVDGTAILQVAMISAPFAFLVGLGAFDYWFYWAIGRPTRPEDHSSHGARTWKDYFRVNTDHKVIGVQYVVHSFVYFIIGGLFAMLIRAQLAAPGGKFVDANTYNGLFSVHATLLIFLFVIPVFAGLANFVLPLMIGAPDMAFPRLNALSFWLLPIAGLMLLGSFFAPGRIVRLGLDRVRAALDERADRAGVLHARGAVRGRLVDRDGAQLPRDDHHDARAGDELLPHAAARVGELLDLAAGRHRDAVHRRLAVLRPARPRARLQLLQRRAAAATC